MRISDLSSDVCSSDLKYQTRHCHADSTGTVANLKQRPLAEMRLRYPHRLMPRSRCRTSSRSWSNWPTARAIWGRSEEHTSELQSLMRNSYAVYCLKKKNTNQHKLTKVLITTYIVTPTLTQ